MKLNTEFVKQYNEIHKVTPDLSTINNDLIHIFAINRGIKLSALKNASSLVQLIAICIDSSNFASISKDSSVYEMANTITLYKHLNDIPELTTFNVSDINQFMILTKPLGYSTLLSKGITPSNRVLMHALTANGQLIRDIPNSSFQMQITAVSNCGDMLGYIDSKQLSSSKWRKLQTLAIENDPYAIQYIDDEELYWKALRIKPEVIQAIDAPTEEMQMFAIEDDPDNLAFINKPTIAVQIEAVKKNPFVIHEMLVCRSEPVHLDVVKTAIEYSKDARIMRAFHHAPDNIKELVIAKYPKALNQIDFQTENMQLIAMNNDPSAYEYVIEPQSDKVVKLIKKCKAIIFFRECASDKDIMMTVKNLFS